MVTVVMMVAIVVIVVGYLDRAGRQQRDLVHRDAAKVGHHRRSHCAQDHRQLLLGVLLHDVLGSV
jgi:hypothetical protein